MDVVDVDTNNNAYTIIFNPTRNQTLPRIYLLHFSLLKTIKITVSYV